ncbi:Site-specific DNA recombinase [Lachnospiraceae bacterium C10]|jgi:DNA invertase Pin-like site-specific DNA recombinase|nr:recombinase family protein [Lachnospiraceae bacterium]SCW83917.1 Site-specific DNA recombinase [Lachnospiraceae bacterium C10]
MIYGYARVSTKCQARDGNSLEAQYEALREAGAEIIYTDSYTGTQMDRPEFMKLLSRLKKGDTLVVSKLDRFARSITQASELITSLIDEGVVIHVLNMGVLDNSPVNVLIRNMLLAFAQFERELIVTRTKEGKEIAKQDPGYHEGHPRVYTDEQYREAAELLKTHTYREVADMTGMSIKTIQRAKLRNRKD